VGWTKNNLAKNAPLPPTLLVGGRGWGKEVLFAAMTVDPGDYHDGIRTRYSLLIKK